MVPYYQSPQSADCDSTTIPWYHTTTVYILQTDAVLQSTLHFPPAPANHHSPKKKPAKTHQRPRTTTHQEPQKKHIDPKAPKAHKATGKIKNRKDKNPLYCISWARIAQWLGRWSCKPMVMGSVPGCGCTPSNPQSDNPQSATRIEDYFRRSQINQPG